MDKSYTVSILSAIVTAVILALVSSQIQLEKGHLAFAILIHLNLIVVAVVKGFIFRDKSKKKKGKAEDEIP